MPSVQIKLFNVSLVLFTTFAVILNKNLLSATSLRIRLSELKEVSQSVDFKHPVQISLQMLIKGTIRVSKTVDRGQMDLSHVLPFRG